MKNTVRHMAFLILLCLLCFICVYSATANVEPLSRQSAELFEKEVIAAKITDKNQKDLTTSDPAWDSIRKQKVSSEKPFTLAELVDMALRNNPTTRQAWETIRVTEFQKKQVQSTLYPQATVAATATRTKTSANQSAADVDDLSYGPSFQITYLLFDFGGRGANIEEAAKNVVAANFQLNQSIQDLVLNVETAYYDLHSADSGLKAAQTDLANAKKVFYSAEQRFDVGLASKLDVLQAKANYEDALYSFESAKAALRNAKANLAKIIGLSADTKFEIAQPSKEIPTAITDNDISNLIEEAIMKRPDISYTRAILQAKQAAVRAANSDLLPSVSLGGSAEANKYHYYDVHKAENDDHTYAGYLQVNWDVFDGFYNLNKKRQTEAEAAVEYEKLIEAELQVSADVWSSYYDFSSAVVKLRFSRAFLDTANTTYELALESYNTGLKSILDLLDAQSKLSDARSKLIQSQRDVFVALAQLMHSTGSLHAKERTLNE
ncbi:MAG: TolC family protein [Candidatus Omnitrophica bacterium]|nr:TolC family protein [Candidatus Omnitrophota bacterium]